MKNFFKARIAPLFGIIMLVAVIGFSMAGCLFGVNDDSNGNGNGDNGGGGGGGNNNSSNPIQLIYNTWTDGIILTSSGGGQQWFKFTATEASQYVHVSFGTLTSLYVQVYDSNGSTVGSEADLWTYSRYTSRTLATGQEYKIRVRPYSSNSSGTYRIGFTNSTTLPRLPFPASTQLSAATWANGNITSSSGEEWFRFTATASTQYIHVLFGTLTSLYVQIYDSNGIAIGSEANMSNLDISRTLTIDQVYYIRVRPSSGSGTYQISFNTTSMPPLISTPIQLSVSIWTDGVILTSSSKEQWFMFTATASTQYVHVSFGTLTDLYLQVYDSNGSTVGSEADLWAYSRYTSRTLTVDQVYYIRVRPYSSGRDGTYKITFNNSATRPSGG